MGSRKKVKCVRCESLERKQKSPDIHYLDEEVPVCAVCLQEIVEEEDYFKRLAVEEDVVGPGENLD